MYLYCEQQTESPPVAMLDWVPLLLNGDDTPWSLTTECNPANCGSITLRGDQKVIWYPLPSIFNKNVGVGKADTHPVMTMTIDSCPLLIFHLH